MAGRVQAEPPTYDLAWWRPRLRRAVPLLALLAAAIVVAVIIAPPADQGLPLDPGSTRPDGTRALVDVLRTVGRDVTIVTPDEMGDAPVVLLLRDQLTAEQRAQLERRVEQGARVVVADDDSSLVPRVVGGLSPLEPLVRRNCRVEAVRDAGEIRPGGGAHYEVTGDADGCYGSEAGSGDVNDDGAWMVITPRGRGHMVAVGTPAFLTNGLLAQADNAVLAVQLLTPRGTDRIEIVRPVLRQPGDEGAAGLSSLVPDRVRAALWQLLFAFGVVVLWRARRLGHPLIDRAPVRLASSDLTTAVGALLARYDARAAALQRVVGATRRRLARRLDLPGNVDIDLLSERLAARTSHDATELARRLDPPPPATDSDLLRASTDLADLEQAVHNELTATLEETDVH
jgi:hypothetical protein